jgi:hypothetical protein
MPQTKKKNVTVAVKTLNTHGHETTCVDDLSAVEYSALNRSRTFRVDVCFTSVLNPRESVTWEQDSDAADGPAQQAKETRVNDIGRTENPVTQRVGARRGHVQQGTKVVNLGTKTCATIRRPDPIQDAELIETITFDDIVCSLEVEGGFCSCEVAPPADNGEAGLDCQDANTKPRSIPLTGSKDPVDFVANAERFFMTQHIVIGKYVRYATEHVQRLKADAARIVGSCTTPSRSLENYFVWGYPGAGKTFFASELAREFGILYVPINVNDSSKVPDAATLNCLLCNAVTKDKCVICALDEIDKRPDANEWLYSSIFTFLESNTTKSSNADQNKVFILLGSTQPDYTAFVDVISDEKRKAGKDLVRRVPYRIEIPRLDLGDLLLTVLSTTWAAHPGSNRITAVSSLALAYLLASHSTNGEISEATNNALARVKSYETSFRAEHLQLSISEWNSFFKLHPSAQTLQDRFVQIHP